MSYRDELNAARANIAALEAENAKLKDKALAERNDEFGKARILTKKVEELFYATDIEGSLSLEAHRKLLDQIEMEFGEGQRESTNGLFSFTRDEFKIEVKSQSDSVQLTITERCHYQPLFPELIGVLLFGGLCVSLISSHLIVSLLIVLIPLGAILEGREKILKPKLQKKKFSSKTQRVDELVSGLVKTGL